MSLGNIGGALNRLQGFVASEYANVRHNQGLSLFPAMIHMAATQADLTEGALFVSAPRLFDGANDVDVETVGVRLLGIIVDNTEAASNGLCVYETTTVVEGTTDIEVYVELDASEAKAMVFPGGIPLAALAWSSTDGGNAAMEAGTLSAANSVKVLFVYAK